MPGPAQEAERSLSSITEAAEGLIRASARSAQKKQEAARALFDAGSESSVAFRYFSAPAAEKTVPPVDWNEALTAARFELRSAHVLAAASVAVGETKPVGDAAALGSLEDAVSEAKADVLQPEGKKAFLGKIRRGEPSRDVPSALQNFKTTANSTVDSVLSDSDKAVSKAIEEIKKRGQNVLAGFDAIAQLVSSGAQLEGLIKAASDKLQSGLRFLSEMLKDFPAGGVREQVERIQNALTVRNALEFAYQVPATRHMIDGLQPRSEVKEIEIDDARDALAQIGTDFSSFAKGVQVVSLLASMVAGIIAAHLTGPLGLLATPATHALLIAVVIAVGVSINNAWVTLRPVHGIRDRIREISAAVAQSA